MCLLPFPWEDKAFSKPLAWLGRYLIYPIKVVPCLRPLKTLAGEAGLSRQASPFSCSPTCRQSGLFGSLESSGKDSLNYRKKAGLEGRPSNSGSPAWQVPHRKRTALQCVTGAAKGLGLGQVQRPVRYFWKAQGQQKGWCIVIRIQTYTSIPQWSSTPLP